MFILQSEISNQFYWCIYVAYIIHIHKEGFGRIYTKILIVASYGDTITNAFSSFLAYSHFLNIKVGLLKFFFLKIGKDVMIYLLKVFCDSRSTCMHISICYTNYRANRIPRLSPSQPNSDGEGKEKNKEEREGPHTQCPWWISKPCRESPSCADSHSECQGTQRLREVVYHFIQSSPHFEVEFEE